MRKPSVTKGQHFGKLTALEIAYKNRNGHLKWQCLCECGREVVVFGTHLVRGNTTSCGCTRFKKGEKHRQWTGYGEISGALIAAIKYSASGNKSTRKPLSFNLTAQYLWELFLAQDKRCALSGVCLSFDNGNTRTRTASIDRIDSSEGYIIGNVQWLHKDVNWMKASFEQQYFVNFCIKIADHYKNSTG